MNKVSIITGGASGIGKAIAEKFMEYGHTVIVIGRDEKKLMAMKDAYPNNCEVIKGNIASSDDIKKIFRIISLNYPVIDNLINSAGFNMTVNTELTFEEAMLNWNSVIATNLTGSFMMAIKVAEIMKRPGGRIINISSIGAFTGGIATGGIAYAASKAGLNGLTFSLARELSSKGITVNSIAPGFIEQTGFTASFPKEKTSEILSQIPVGRAGKSKDIADICYFLCSEEASYITGEIINVNGGWLFGR
ncbi:SDR family NAD(P)-dependent oxidoreductase [Chryseobacterium rhizosphaerae]|jgi:3-oxoacyl-[acyl-carrier protein] reductase|uniref:SDR family NAD(P)-dependent oxidoreductase n=1 Tax=Chryseobacterium rhizosphaerae TaxID=395937 RepID=A0ABX9IGY2_9FLAO|nr:SDR family NAD(P)-dependent oxidoreductase [Chryseobacterium rhizosphaerae]MDR6548150.1 3-oxoacyl-[acyl-carrier protein] reductase [Chryseobacterium rhizosphaerae]REC72639.1 SDR family NAD(P)-dependent oxidoreductase [Chryseobacterium rhizosphaerae]GEN69222.1 3-oxoacyl-[acyl-carrier-protein] reductase FabG [Chryseobacterium rhizosphaerae]